MHDYWIGDLVDASGIQTVEDAHRRLDEDSALRDVAERYDDYRKPLDALPSDRGEVIVAGSVLDLSGHLDCMHAGCIIRRVDELFGRVWHYFDTVVVSGMSSRNLSEFAKNDPTNARRYMLSHIETYLYLREIGAEQMLVFREKPHWCMDHLPTAAERLGVPRFAELRDEFIEKTVRLDMLKEPPRYENGMWHLALERPWGGVYFLKVDLGADASREQVLRAGAAREFHQIADLYAGDVLRADAYESPLAVANTMHGEWLSGGRPVSDDQVALSLTLPFLQNASPEEIAKIRREEAASFAAFRLALRTAIREHVANAPEGATNEQVAREIYFDVLSPAVTEIERSLRAAERTMFRKSASRVLLGAAGLTAGLLTGVPTMVASGLGLAVSATSLPPIDAFIDEKKQIELKDMYFLWQAHKRLPQT